MWAWTSLRRLLIIQANVQDSLCARHVLSPFWTLILLTPQQSHCRGLFSSPLRWGARKRKNETKCKIQQERAFKEKLADAALECYEWNGGKLHRWDWVRWWPLWKRLDQKFLFTVAEGIGEFTRPVMSLILLLIMYCSCKQITGSKCIVVLTKAFSYGRRFVNISI